MRRVIDRVIRCAALALCLADVACQKTHTYETQVVLHTVQVVHRDEKGTPLVIEVTVEYPDCPGEQYETLQGNASFASCMAKYQTNATLPATVVHQPMPEGHYDSEIERIGDCVRHRDPRDLRSYEDVQVCHDVLVNGLVVGFHCDRTPSKDLLTKCPWFARK